MFDARKTVRKLSTPRQVAEFLVSHPHAFVITRANKHNELRDELPGDIGELSRHRNFLGREGLIAPRTNVNQEAYRQGQRGTKRKS